MAVIDKTNLTPKLTPTEKPVIKYTDKNGESYMAREVQLENGYKCMAVSNTKNPAQATLMNHDVFEKTLKDSIPEKPVQRHAGDTFEMSKNNV